MVIGIADVVEYSEKEAGFWRCWYMYILVYFRLRTL